MALFFLFFMCSTDQKLEWTQHYITECLVSNKLRVYDAHAEINQVTVLITLSSQFSDEIIVTIVWFVTLCLKYSKMQAEQ